MTAADAAEVDVEVEADAWTLAVPGAEARARRAALAALAAAPDLAPPRPGLVILLADDEAVRDLNARFRGKDAPTNVLAFPSPDPGRVPGGALFGAGPSAHLGDIALAYGVCAREAREQGKPLADHLAHLVIHGVLHLLGFDHQDEAEAEVMEARERTLLAGMGVPDPRGPAPRAQDARAQDAGAQDDGARHAPPSG
jgi:probable rRNA maturation factor